MNKRFQEIRDRVFPNSILYKKNSLLSLVRNKQREKFNRKEKKLSWKKKCPEKKDLLLLSV